MPKYEFDAERWLRNVAEVQSHRAGAGPAMLRENMLKCAEEIHRLRAENDTLRNEARVYREQCAMRDEWRDKVEAELAALKGATVHIYNSGYHAGHHDTVEGRYVDIHSNDMSTYHAEDVAELLAALVGEE